MGKLKCYYSVKFCSKWTCDHKHARPHRQVDAWILAMCGACMLSLVHGRAIVGEALRSGHWREENGRSSSAILLCFSACLVMRLSQLPAQATMKVYVYLTVRQTRAQIQTGHLSVQMCMAIL